MIDEFWRNPVYERGSFFLESDEVPENLRGPIIRNGDEFQRYIRTGQIGRLKLQPSFQPKPYTGDIRNSPILILMKNPGYSLESGLQELIDRNYSELLLKIRTQRIRHIPFLLPPWNVAAAGLWWYKLFGGFARDFASAHSRNVEEVLTLISEKVSVLDLVPYRSIKFPRGDSVLNLQSVRHARLYAQEQIQTGNRAVFLYRGVRQWNLSVNDRPNLRINPAAYRRCSVITMSSPCGRFLNDQLLTLR